MTTCSGPQGELKLYQQKLTMGLTPPPSAPASPTIHPPCLRSKRLASMKWFSHFTLCMIAEY